MARVIAVANQKGGVGKTTTAINLTASLARAQRRVLMIDSDPQGNATSGVGLVPNQVDVTVFDVLLRRKPIADAILETDVGLNLVAANRMLHAAQTELLSDDRRRSILRDALAPILDKFDYIVIDCPPVLNILTVNSLVAANGIIVPTQCEYFSMQGLVELLETIKRIRTVTNKGIQIEGILRTMYDRRNRLSGEVSDQLQKHFGDEMFRTIIPRNVRLAEAPSHGLPVIDYDKNCAGAISYIALTGELLGREHERTK